MRRFVNHINGGIMVRVLELKRMANQIRQDIITMLVPA
ncbi:MAG: transketolase, partial [Desulfitobacterium hafniense]